MEKEALIKIIIQDVLELDTLLNTFTGKSEISKAFIQLSRNKAKGILEEIDLLENMVSTTSSESVKTGLKDPEKIRKIIDNQEEIVHEDIIKIIHEPEEKKVKLAEHELFVKQEKNKIAPEEKDIAENSTKQETVLSSQSYKKSSEPITIGEKLMRGSQSFYDTLPQKKESTVDVNFQNRPVKNIINAIGINDRFYLQKELFGGDAKLFNSTISQLNLLNDIESAEKLLAETFNWDENSEPVLLFKNILKRRYL